MEQNFNKLDEYSVGEKVVASKVHAEVSTGCLTSFYKFFTKLHLISQQLFNRYPENNELFAEISPDMKIK